MYTYIYMYIHIYIDIYMNIYIYTYVHIYIYNTTNCELTLFFLFSRALSFPSGAFPSIKEPYLLLRTETVLICA